MPESTLFGDVTRLLTYDQVAEVFGVGASTIYEWIRDGRFPPPARYGRTSRFDPKVVQKVKDEGLSLPGTHREFIPRDRKAEARRAKRRQSRRSR